MEPEPRLLEHPFYRAWERGDVTPGQLADYAVAYQAFMDRVPTYWQRVLDGLGVDDPTGEKIVAEEREHAGLWTQWRTTLSETTDAPDLSNLFEALAGLSPSELAGALHAYEVQQPDVARTKKAGLLDHYGADEADLAFFDEHVDEDEHVAFGATLRDECADPAAFDRGFRRGADHLYHSLDPFAGS